MIQHVFDAILVTGLILGMLGSVYTAYAFVPTPLLQKFSVAFTLMLIGLFIAGFIVGLSALDATFFPHSRILSTILGVIIWVLFGLLILFYLLLEAGKRERSRPDPYSEAIQATLLQALQHNKEKDMNTPSLNSLEAKPPSSGGVEEPEEQTELKEPEVLNEQNRMDLARKWIPNNPSYGLQNYQLWETLEREQSLRDLEEKENWKSFLWKSVLTSIPWDQVILLVWPFVIAGMLAWGRAAFFIVTQGYTLLYIGSTILVVVGGGGFIYGFRRPSDDKPHIFSLDKLFVIIAGVLTFGLSILIHFQLGASTIPIFITVLIFLLIIIPVLTAAMGFAPFLKAKVYKLTDKEKDLGRIGLGFLFFGFLLQLIQPLVDLWH